MHKFIHRVLIVLCWLAAAGLLLSYLSVYINPEKFWFFALIGLSYPFILTINLLFLAYWVIRWKRLFLIPFIAILLGTSHLLNFIHLPFDKKDEGVSPDIKVVSYNINLFRLYAWSKRKPSFNKIFDFVKGNSIDVACFQEFYMADGKLSESDIQNDLGMNAHIESIIKSNSTSYGIATFSKYPIINRGEIAFKNTSNACIFTDIKVGPDTIRIYNCHLQSLRLKERNLSFLLNQSHKDDVNTVAEIKDISFKFRDALKKRAQQVNMISEDVKRCPYPVIICGDFNDSPISYTYHKMAQNMTDAFKEVGKGFANTYVRFFPYRIDYILYSKELKATNFSSPRVTYSDHYPVISSFVLNK